MLRIAKHITSVQDWFDMAPPQGGAAQWRDGRSAKELAKAWFPSPGSPQVPDELQQLLASRPETQGVTFERGEPERVVRFDSCGEGRHADLVLWGHSSTRKVLVSIEAKADEPFGEIAGEYVRKTIAAKPRSRVPERFELLCQGILNVASDDKQARALRYQLFTAVAGAMVEAARYRADLVLFVVHEFVRNADPKKVKANADDLNAFVRVLSRGSISAVSPGTLAGPFSVPGNKHFAGTEKLFIGKCRCS